MTCLQDEETQRRGIVTVVYSVGPLRILQDLSVTQRVHSMREGIPQRISGVHFCYEDVRARPLVACLQLVLGKNIRGRFRPHLGEFFCPSLTLKEEDNNRLTYFQFFTAFYRHTFTVSI